MAKCIGHSHAKGQKQICWMGCCTSASNHLPLLLHRAQSFVKQLWCRRACAGWHFHGTFSPFAIVGRPLFYFRHGMPSAMLKPFFGTLGVIHTMDVQGQIGPPGTAAFPANCVRMFMLHGKAVAQLSRALFPTLANCTCFQCPSYLFGFF